MPLLRSVWQATCHGDSATLMRSLNFTMPLLLPLLLGAQERAATDTRAGQIEAAEQAKATAIQAAKPVPDQKDSILSKAFKIWNFSQTGREGISLRLGGLAAGSGLALGPDYTLKLGELYDPDLIWDTYVVGSYEGYYRAQTGVELPRLLNGHAFFEADALRFDYPRLSYYGEGPDSRKGGRTDYRMQDDEAEIRGGLQLFRKARAGILGSFQRIDIRSGTGPGLAQTASTYQLPEAQAMAREADFFSGGFFLRYDGRDAPEIRAAGRSFPRLFRTSTAAGPCWAAITATIWRPSTTFIFGMSAA